MIDRVDSYIKVYFAAENGSKQPPYVMDAEGDEKIGYQFLDGAVPTLKIYSGSKTALIPMSRIDFVDMNL